MKYPLEGFFSKGFYVAKLKVFGCLVSAHLRKVNKEPTLRDNAKTEINLRMDSGLYRIMLKRFRQVIVIKYATLDEGFFRLDRKKIGDGIDN